MAERCFLRSRLFAAHGLHGIVSLRIGGVSLAPYDSLNLADDTGDDASAVQRNMEILLQQTGVGAPLHRARQVHGCSVLRCSGDGRQHNEQADILLSVDGSPLAVRIADCAPVLLADTGSNMLCAVHAGWRGTAAAIAGQAVRHMLDGGAEAANIVACIGPCIGPCCFEIGADTADELAASCPGADAFIHVRDGRRYADLAAINSAQLLQAGIKQENVERLVEGAAGCTCCNAGDFFSYRRDGRASGRHLAIVASMSDA
jgi:purine-nucleoside/S-methyl-5'-thioadenosine phosphorylase / adenosine deaminase